MTDCGCSKARQDLEEYLRNEVCKTEHTEIREHLENCPSCRDEALVAKTLTDPTLADWRPAPIVLGGILKEECEQLKAKLRSSR